MLGLHFPPELAVNAQIEALGYETTDVTHVIASHTHFDHPGGLYLFPHARIYAGESDMRFGSKPDPAGAGFFRQADITPQHGKDVAESIRSIPRLKLLQESAAATILISHDPGDWAELGHAPHCFE